NLSIFESKGISDIYMDIQKVYLDYPFPWVIGYSGGKDSTATLQLIWNAISLLPEEQRNKNIYVISSDTLVETPVIISFIDEAINQINEAAKKQKLPITAHKLVPKTEDTFWVNLIGKGYPAPNSAFRWCTDRMKIKPSNTFILDKVAEHGEVILALGMRRNESERRNKVIDNYELIGYKLARHGQLRGSWVFMPIENFTTDDVWTYLLSQPNSPWGGNNRNLAALYRSAQAGECPLVVDNTTPPCGNSRFGCWTCTVVARDKSMEALIDSGEEWMIPLLEFRDWLSSTQNPEVKPFQREYRSRDGRIKISENGVLRYRTYTLDFSKEMIRRLLQTQIEVQNYNPGFKLINFEELKEIRRIWITERQDWNDSLPEILKEITGEVIPKNFSDVFTPGMDDSEILNQVSEEYNIPPRLVQKLLDAEWQNYGLFRRSSIHNKIESIFSEDWRSFEEVQKEILRIKDENVQ
ncbi:MAG: DNA phosphorothioation system sulfurtransferase DndC, partial [Bacteroidales bacterium]|nr:DNA phosphorothioation system sulfurtransferase DndC [Bacteroidales bacterium]